VLVQANAANGILAGLSPADFALLQPHLVAADLPVRRQLEIRNRAIDHVYFVEAGLVSMVVSAGAHHSIEVGVVGAEGMTGLPILMETDRATYETFIQTAGNGWRIGVQDLRDAMEKSPGLRATFLRFAFSLVTQMAFTALANGRYKIEERLARWLLMANDRAKGDVIRLTHDSLAVMLGARRAGVTLALNEFQKRGIIQTQRGVIDIKDRAALEEAANGSYGGPETEYRRLFGQSA
jgi:CRP-like cAMP-binding protein